jgi:8-oxo-dGTP pyrophosphatase MutT (NUDIX family)
VKQLRPAIRDTLTEIPAGLLDVKGEDALTCAARELREETGYVHESIEFLGGYYASAGFSDEYVHLFWATTRPEPQAPPEDDLELISMPLDRMTTAARTGKIRDVKTALALLMYAAQ